ncbi:MAG: hypothetical protein MUC43_16045 [Pirellula sp.]|nr:hypothetical protein [Pirellula sp.]
MNNHPITALASPSLASPHFDAAFDSIESVTTSFATYSLPILETTTFTEAALGYHPNGQYSITAITTSTGAVAERYAYTAYGQPTILNASCTPIGNQQSQIADRFTYTGSEWDETLGLYHFRARWMSGLSGRFLSRDPMKCISGFNISRSYLSLQKMAPFGLFEGKPPFPGATPDPDRVGCYTMMLQDFIDMITCGHDPGDAYLTKFSRGCVCLTKCAQIGGTCSKPHAPPEYEPGTTCAKAQKTSDPIPDVISKKPCGKDEERFIFAKRGIDNPRGWELDGDRYKIPGFKLPPDPPVIGNNGDPLSGLYNYIWYVNGWYVWVNHGLDVTGQGDNVVSICDKPLDSPDYPLTLWCVTCKKKCATTTYPVFLIPENPQPTR